MKEAQSLLEQNVKHEKETDACVSKWRKQNAKWLRKRKRVEKTEAPILEEKGRVQNKDISRAKMMEKLSESFKPTILLSDDGNLKAKIRMNSKQQWTNIISIIGRRLLSYRRACFTIYF